MKKRGEDKIIFLLFVSLIISLILSFLLKDITAKISRDYIEFIIGLSITLAGFGLVSFQIARASNELKKDFIELSIFMIISSLFEIYYWVNDSYTAIALIGSFFFLWGLILLLVILFAKRFDIIN